MKKVFLDNNNTIDSVRWDYKGFQTWKNSNPTGYQVSPGKVWMNNYLIARAGDDTATLEAHTLAEAKAAINEEVAK